MSVANKTFGRVVLACSLGALLAACGGGGGGGSAGTGGSGITSPDGSNTAPATAPADGSQNYALLTWEAPTTNADGSCLTDLEGYRVSYGLSPQHYTETVDIDVSEMAASPTGKSGDCGEIQSYTFLVDNLDTASWYFTVQAVDTEGNTSEYSNEVVKTVQ